MTLSEILRQAFATFRAHKMRTFLTMFGIVWGIASVILLVGLGRGFVVDQKKHMETLGKDLVIMWGGRTSAQVGGRAAGREIHLNVDDADLIRDECYLVKNVSPELRRTIPEVSQYNLANRGVVGMWPSYQDFRSLKVSEGRLITDDDEARRPPRAWCWDRRRTGNCFPDSRRSARRCLVKSIPYSVVGVLAREEAELQLQRPRQRLTCSRRIRRSRATSLLRKNPAPASRAAIWTTSCSKWRIPKSMKRPSCKCGGRSGACTTSMPLDKDALFIWDTMDGAKQLAKIFGVVTIFFGCVAIVTLCLGGIGVMNIMLVSVTERTREIGTRKAMGATKRDILRQFFAESAMLTIVERHSWTRVRNGNRALRLKRFPCPTSFRIRSFLRFRLLLSILTLSLITVTAGMYPAQRAADMTPVESLRYE